MTIIYLTLGWAAGLVLAAHSATLTALPVLLFSASSLGMALLRRKHPAQRTLLLVLAFAGFGALRMLAASASPPPDALAHTNGQGWRTIEGVISAEPDVRDTHVNLRLQVDTLYHYDTPQPASGSVLIQAPRYGTYAYGDRVKAAGLILTPPEFDDFSYRDYLARQGILTWIPHAEVEHISSGHGNPFRHSLYAIKGRAQSLIASAIPEPQSSLLTGILLGVETGISPEVREAFNATGSSHVIAISGFNMTLIAGLISRALSLIWPRRRALTTVLSIATIGAYTVLVGANPPVIRAALMSSLLFVAPLFRRRTYVPASLAFAALLMSLHDPFVLWDIGFQLSFAAVLGLALLAEPLERFFRRLLSWRLQTETVEKLLRLLSEPLIVTLAAQITTTPLIALYFGRLSISSLAVNFLILPVQAPLLMLGGLGTL
ncbi:MAG: ComEC/Rec2 family competence protein, partial [Anaerolineae bacterium]|nr:ComEC/Rec2 family competence protein [Anaerolineae bacterium]